MTSKGQVTIPKSLREKFDLKAGSRVEFVIREGELILQPRPEDPIEELESLKAEVSFSDHELEEMVKDSRNAWSSLK